MKRIWVWAVVLLSLLGCKCLPLVQSFHCLASLEQCFSKYGPRSPGGSPQPFERASFPNYASLWGKIFFFFTYLKSSTYCSHSPHQWHRPGEAQGPEIPSRTWFSVLHISTLMEPYRKLLMPIFKVFIQCRYCSSTQEMPSVYYVPGTVLGSGDMILNKSLHSRAYILEGKTHS